MALLLTYNDAATLRQGAATRALDFRMLRDRRRLVQQWQ
jgi:hypothetical protein